MATREPTLKMNVALLRGFDNEQLMSEVLRRLGLPLDADGIAATPARWLAAMSEMTSGYNVDPEKILARRFTEADGYDEMVIVRNVPFWSLCEHHLLPFHGHATVAYLPFQEVVGLSKIPRLVHCFARRFQLQERMTKQIAHTLSDELGARGVGVVVRAKHTCMAARGIGSDGMMETSAMLGWFRTKPEVRAEFLALTNGK